MHYYCTRKDSTQFIRWYREYSINGDYAGYGAKKGYGEYDSYAEIGDVIRSVSELDNAQVIAPGNQFSSSQGGYNMGSINGYVFTDSPYLWFPGDAVTSSYDVTLYRYRDRTEAVSYVYYTVGEYSEWSSAPVEENEELAVETRTLYRYK